LLKSRIATALAAAGAALLFQPVAQAFNFGDMMSPGKWMGGNKYDDEDYYDRDYGPYGPPPGAYGYPPYRAAPYGGSYGAPGYGAPYPAPYGAAPAWTAPAQPVAPAASAPVTAPPAVAAPAARDAKSQEIEALKRRIDELEARQAPPPPAYPPLPPTERGTGPATSGIGAGTALPPPSFRPLDKY
jgi:hypothetical protein